MPVKYREVWIKMQNGELQPWRKLDLVLYSESWFCAPAARCLTRSGFSGGSNKLHGPNPDFLIDLDHKGTTAVAPERGRWCCWCCLRASSGPASLTPLQGVNYQGRNQTQRIFAKRSGLNRVGSPPHSACSTQAELSRKRLSGSAVGYQTEAIGAD